MVSGRFLVTMVATGRLLHDARSISYYVQSTVLPSITSEFKESNQASWIGTSYVSRSIPPCPTSHPYITSGTCFLPAHLRLFMDVSVQSSADEALVKLVCLPLPSERFCVEYLET